MKKLHLVAVLLTMAAAAQAQKVDDILNKYYENSGGKARWDSLRNVRMAGTVTVQGMAIPVTIWQTADGKQKVSIKFQGQELTQMAFDGQQGWSTNFMTQKPEKMSEEANRNMQQQVMDFPDALHRYKEKAYTATLEEKETIEGKEAFKIKLVKKPVTLDGQEQENVVYYFFDTETYLPVAMRTISLSPETRGAAVETLLGDYRLANGLLFPFRSEISYNGQPGETMKLDTIETNVEIAPGLFAFPAK